MDKSLVTLRCSPVQTENGVKASLSEAAMVQVESGAKRWCFVVNPHGDHLKLSGAESGLVNAKPLIVVENKRN